MSNYDSKEGGSDSNKSRRGRRGMPRMAFPNDPEAFDIHSSSQNQYSPSKLANETDIGETSSELSSLSLDNSSSSSSLLIPPHLKQEHRDSSNSSDDYLRIEPSHPLHLNSSHFKKAAASKTVRQDMLPSSASGLNTPERVSPGFNPALGMSQEVGTSSQLDMGAPRPGHGRAPSLGTPSGSSSSIGLRRNVSSLVTNVDKHGGPRRRRSKTNLRSNSRSLSRPGSPTGSVCSDVSSVSGKSLTIVLKLGTSSICDPVTHMPMLANLSMMVETIVKLKELGHRVVLVSSGAVGLGLRRLDIPIKPKELAVIQVSNLF
ncbi:Glutamate 5-kinase [Kickxella alabastrina]|nr:Glutamate 5-kinase [Kickxella alabastrina]